MIDRKVGDKPITFEVSIGKCVKLFSKAEKESQEQGDATCYWQLCRRTQESASEEGLHIWIKPWSSFLWVAVKLGILTPSCLYSQMPYINTNPLTQYMQRLTQYLAS